MKCTSTSTSTSINTKCSSLLLFMLSLLLMVDTQIVCPCHDHRLCQRLYTTSKGSKELIMYTHNPQHYLNWHWQNITIVMTDGLHSDPGLMCHAHMKNTKFGLLVTGITSEVFHNKTKRIQYINSTYKKAVDHFYDVISFDIQERFNDLHERTMVIDFAKEVRTIIHNRMEITFNMPLCPKCSEISDSTCEDLSSSLYQVANVSDFITVEFCNINIHGPKPRVIKPSCVGRPVTAYSSVIRGYDEFILAGVPLSKIVMAVPWFGYDFKCTSLRQSTALTHCHTGESKSDSVHCPDQTIVGLQDILQLKLRHKSEAKWVEAYRTPYFDYMDFGNVTHQVWYEDFISVLKKLQLAKDFRIRGVAVMYADYLNYGSDSSQKYLADQMWQDLEYKPAEDHPPVHWTSSLAGIAAALSVVLILVGVLIGISIGAWLYKYKLSKKNFSHQRITEEAEPMTTTEMNHLSSDSNGTCKL